MKKYISLISAVLLSATFSLSAKPISPQTALNRALVAPAAASGIRSPKSADKNSSYKLAYSAPTGTFHVFNRNSGGYIVVAGDDEIYPLLADVTEGSFSEESAAPAALWLLETYNSEIQSFTETQSETAIMDYYAQWTDISPLLTTQWNQDYPYNKFCPAIGGVSCVTGCVATSMAQVVNHNKFFNGNGYRFYNGTDIFGNNVEFDYGSESFDFSLMFDTYPGNCSDDAINEVGRLMLACGLSVSMSYGKNESAAVNENIATALIDFFGYDSDNTLNHRRSNYTQAQWENMIYRELQLGRPVCYSGYSQGGGHAFVLDGYRQAGLYHINWGWGGTSDGYFRLSALSPSQSGIGGGSGGYNIGQSMVCAVPKGAEPGVTYGNMGGSISVVSEGVYSLYYKSNGRNNFNINLGAVVTDTCQNRVATATFWTGHNVTASGAIHHESYPYDFSSLNLPAGDYLVYPAFQPADGEYIVADPINGRQHYIALTVTSDGKMIFENTPSSLATPDIHISGIVPGYDLHEGFSGPFGFNVINDGRLDYDGKISVTLVADDGQELCTLTTQSTTAAAGANTVFHANFQAYDNTDTLIPAGTYGLIFHDNKGVLLSDRDYSIEIRSGKPLSVWNNDEALEVTNTASIPDRLVSGHEWPHTPFVYNRQQQSNMTLRIAFYPPGGNAAQYTFIGREGRLEPMNDILPLNPVTLNLPFGNYEVCYRKGYSQISERKPVTVGETDGQLCGFPTADGRSISVSQIPGETASGHVTVPSTMTVAGKSLTVTEIDKEGFFSSNISSIDIPETVTTIGANAFTLCQRLRQIIIRGKNPPLKYVNHIAPGLSAETEFYVPASAYETYSADAVKGRNPLYAIVESIASGKVTVTAADTRVSIEITPSHEAVNPAFSIAPADDRSASIAEITIISYEPGRLNLRINPLEKGTATFLIRPAHHSDDYAVLSVNVPELTAIEEIPADADPTPDAAYDLQGRQRNSENLTPGIYISKNKKFIVR